MRKDKKKVVGEPMTDEQIQAFLNYEPEQGESPDFHILLRAYRGLREEDFLRFLTFFKQAGYDTHAQDAAGRTLADIISQHTKSDAYLTALQNH